MGFTKENTVEESSYIQSSDATSFEENNITFEEKINFFKWVVESGVFYVYDNDKPSKNPQEGFVLMRPKDGRGNSLIIRWEAQKNIVWVDIYKKVGVFDYDFGSMREGRGYVDSFAIEYEDVKEYTNDILKMWRDKRAKSEALEHEKNLKCGNSSNFLAMMQEREFFNDFPNRSNDYCGA